MTAAKTPPQPSNPYATALEHLLRSAIRQFQDSQSDLEKRPDRSLLSFYIGLELTLKARLFAEHWSLVLETPGSHAMVDLLAGKCKTVSLDDCLQRLTTVAGVHFSKHEKHCYEAVRQHRNRVVHFYHEAHTAGAGDAARLAVLVDQWRAWPYLRRRITHEWNALFAPVLAELQRLDLALKRDVTYLAARYEAIAAEVATRTQGGAVFVWCPVCEYDTDQLDGQASKDPLVNSKCLVCETTDRVLKTTCPKCEKLLALRCDLQGSCSCGYVPDSGIALHVTDKALGYAISSRDAIDELDIVCGECGLPSVALVNGEYLCCNCFEWASRVESCGCCDQAVTGWDSEGSFLTGCVMCDGRGDHD